MKQCYYMKYVDFVVEKDKSILSAFRGGAQWGSHPHYTPHYYVIAARCGYGDDLWSYATEHDFCHHFLAERMFDSYSTVLYCMAQELKILPHIAAQEEALVQMFQRWLRANEEPIIDGINWHNLKEDALEILEEHGYDYSSSN